MNYLKGKNDYLNEEYFNIINDITTKKIYRYSLKDLLEFKEDFFNFSCNEMTDEMEFFKEEIFEMVFKVKRILRIMKLKHPQMLKIQDVFILNQVLQINDIRLSEKYIKKILKSNMDKDMILKLACIYELTCNIIDMFIEKMMQKIDVISVRYKFDFYDEYWKCNKKEYSYNKDDEKVFEYLLKFNTDLKTKKVSNIKKLSDIEKYIESINKRYNKHIGKKAIYI